jgi:NAD(P)-dependent dehydrogenase (short-subunit alcohol dehydrogenase family)
MDKSKVLSGFSGASTAEEVIQGIDLTGKIAIVTGGYAGIGLETTRVLHAAGARVIVPARDIKKAETALRGLERVEIGGMDLADPASIDAFAKKFLASGRPLHILVNSAGIMAPPLVRDARGHESQFATNHLGHFQLTARLWPALLEAGQGANSGTQTGANGGTGARVVSVSSWGHRFSPFIFEDPDFQNRPYERWSGYGQSKTANILFAVALDARGKSKNIRAFALHPGTIVSTDLKRYISEEDLKKAGVLDADGRPVLDPSRQLKTVEQGAATSVWCATSPQLDTVGGVYCENCNVSHVLGSDTAASGGWDTINMNERPAGALGVYPYAIDPEAAERLWVLSERLTGAQTVA